MQPFGCDFKTTTKKGQNNRENNGWDAWVPLWSPQECHITENLQTLYNINTANKNNLEAWIQTQYMYGGGGVTL